MPAVHAAERMVRVDASRIDEIVDQVMTLMRDPLISGITWKGETEWDLPAQNEVLEAPWLAIPEPEFDQYGVGHAEVGEWEMPAEFEEQHWWLISVYCIGPYHPGDATTRRTVARAVTALQATAKKYRNLEGYCDTVQVGKPYFRRVGEIEPNQRNGGGGRRGPPIWFVGILPLRVQETIRLYQYAEDIA